jgi:hypothetical protein
MVWAVRLQFDDWTARMATPPDAVALLRKLMRSAPTEVQTALTSEADCSFTLQCALIEGVKV